MDTKPSCIIIMRYDRKKLLHTRFLKRLANVLETGSCIAVVGELFAIVRHGSVCVQNAFQISLADMRNEWICCAVQVNPTESGIFVRI